ncbi:DNA/RNA polymerases superfamily protein [Gossypium australe]|uniref:DNA/RNA polymerases superfamily protein n=1 Tax=Gossypium australe TaxID=47621 RepID=A0A5B6WR28_9ROSI|nr:DNA/RNA polymerases superfamily protein [Gossypium australe]
MLIISDRDPRFTSRFWRQLHESLGTKLNFNTAFHLQADEQLRRVIQILEDMLRAYIIYFEVGLERYSQLVKFLYNNSFQSSIHMTLYEVLYDLRCRHLFAGQICVKEKLLGQKSYAYLKHQDIDFFVGDKVFLKVSSWKKALRFGRKGNLSPRFIRPYKIIKRIRPITYGLALLVELQNMHDVFHVLMLRRYQSDLSHIISIE